MENSTTTATFAAWLKARRKEYGYTQRELAEAVGCSSVTIEKIEAGVNRPSRQIAELIAQVLEVAPAEVEAFVRFARGEHGGQSPQGVTHVPTRGSASNAAAGPAPEAVAAPPTMPTAPAVAKPPGNLPALLTAIIGRESDVETIVARLAKGEARLLTLVGPPGIGKTRLALEAASGAARLEAFADGVYFVALATIGDYRLVGDRIAQALGLKEAGPQGILATIATFIGTRRILLVLDNFEQVVAAATVVADLLGMCPALAILATSREPLRVRGEHQYPVPPLALPDLSAPTLPPVEELARYPSVALFVDRAQSVKPDFELTEENSRPVAAVCARLDGLPLAIELVATRTKLLPPAMILTRLGDTLSLLTGGARDLPARHQTIRAAIGWSYDLLEESEKRLFNRMGVFVGGCTFPAITAVCAATDGSDDTLEIVGSLLDKSLLRLEEQTSPSEEARYTMLETVRAFAAERLAEAGEDELIGRYHAEYFLAVAEAAESQLTGPDQKLWLDRLEHDHDNLRAALRRSLDRGEQGDYAVALRIVGAVWRFWWVHGHMGEGRRWTAEAISLALSLGYLGEGEASPEKAAALARAYRGGGLLATHQGDYNEAQSLLEESLALFKRAGDMQGVANSLNSLGYVAQCLGDTRRAVTIHEESLALKRELGDRRGIANSLNNLANAAFEQGEYAHALELVDESLSIYRELGDSRSVANTLHNMGMIARTQGDRDREKSLYVQSLQVYRELGDRQSIVISLNGLAQVERDAGNHAEAEGYYREAIALGRELMERREIAIALQGFAAIAAARGEFGRAVVLLAAMRALREAISSPLPAEDQSYYFGILASARSGLSAEEYPEMWAKGHSMTLDQALAYALDDE